MARNYTDLSRRALIKLNQDFDQENDASLLQYLTENDKKYEGIRPMESVIDRADQIKETLSGSKNSIKDMLSEQADKVLDSVIKSLSSISDISRLNISEESEEF